MWQPAVTVGDPSAEPVSRDEAKEYLRIDAGDVSFDNQVDRFIAAARADAEAITNTRLITQTVNIAASGFSWLGVLPTGPVQSVEEIKYLDTDAAERTLAPADYELIGAGLEKAIVPATNVTWPSAAVRQDAVRVEAIVGYGGAGSDVPQDIGFALLQAIRAKMDETEFDLAAALVNHRIWQ